LATVESPAIQTLVGPSGPVPPVPVPPLAVTEVDAAPPEPASVPVTVAPPALLVLAALDEVPMLELVLLVLAEVAAVSEPAPPSVVVLAVPRLAENPPVPSVVLVTNEAVELALAVLVVLAPSAWLDVVFVPESEAQELTQAAQPRHQRSV